MSERYDETRMENALREGLQNLPVPETSPDFAARIHTALEQTPPWWIQLWLQARPMLSAAACAAVVMLILLPALTQTPIPVATDSSSRRVTLTALDAALDRPDLSAATLSGISTHKPVSTTPSPKSPKTPRPIPESRAPITKRPNV